MDIKLDFNIFENTTTDIHMEMNIFVDVLTRAVESKSLKVGKSLKIGKNRIKSEKSDLISY